MTGSLGISTLLVGSATTAPHNKLLRKHTEVLIHYLLRGKEPHPLAELQLEKMGKGVTNPA